MGEIQLRPYQSEAIDAIFRQWDGENNRTLLVLPTGCGKTICFAMVTKRLVDAGKRVLILAHRAELLDQAADKLLKATGIYSCMEKAKDSALGRMEMVTVGSVQTMQNQKRLSLFPRDYYDAIIIDEAHHCISQSYRNVIDYFSEACLLGVTATPDRGDMRGMNDVFNSIAYEYSLFEAIKSGYLSKIIVQTIPLKIDLSGVHISQGDFAVNEVGNALDPYLPLIAAEMKKYCKNRKTVVFLPLVQTSQKFRDYLNENGFSACEVNGNSKDREEVLADFDSGKYNVICNSMLLTEGWDCPSVDCVIVLRPTKVRALYSQMIGRGTRLSEGKENLLVLDFMWQTERHDLCRPACLIGKEQKKADQIMEVIDEDTDHAWDLSEAEAVAEEKEASAAADRERALADALAQNAKKKGRAINILDLEVLLHFKPEAPVWGWETQEASERQKEALLNQGINADGMNAGTANKWLDKLSERRNKGLATIKQINQLQKRGFQRVGEWTFEEASAMITRIANAGWRNPNGVNPKEYLPERLKPVFQESDFLFHASSQKAAVNYEEFEW